jgi:hypothetical protein
MITLLRLAVVVIVLMLLARAARAAWRQRRLAGAVWRRVRPRHVAGSLALVTVVLGFALGLLVTVPATGIGAGSLIGLHGNAVFAPLEEATLRAGDGSAEPSLAPADRPRAEPPAGAAGRQAPSPWIVGLTVTFLGGLLLLFPWLAYVEERVFREGLEQVSLGRELWTALKFGLLHMIMLIPLAAALAIGLAGFAYGRIYRRAYRRAAARATVVEGPFGVPVTVERPVARLRSEAVLESTVWHTAFNSTIVVLVLAAFLADWYLL